MFVVRRAVAAVERWAAEGELLGKVDRRWVRLVSLWEMWVARSLRSMGRMQVLKELVSLLVTGDEADIPMVVVEKLRVLV